MARRYLSRPQGSITSSAEMIARTAAADPAALATALDCSVEEATQLKARMAEARDKAAGNSSGQPAPDSAEFDQLVKEQVQQQLANMLREQGAGGGRLNLGAPAGNGPDRGGVKNPLAYTGGALTELQASLDARRSGRVYRNATLTTGTLGAGREWAANVLSGPRLLHVVAGVPTTPADAIYAQFPQFTLPTATGSVAEGVTVTEYAASAAGSLTMGRFGRFTDLSRESQIGADAEAVIAMHQLGVAKDLDKVLIDAVETAAGSAVAFTADVPAAIRKAIALVLDNTAEENASSLVVLVHPDNAALLQDVAPVGGETIAEGFQRFSGALVYPSSAVNTGFMTVANLRVGTRYFEAEGMQTETDMNVKTSVLTAATSVIAGYGVSLVSGFASMVDVVTP